jgi:hypothetical protein
MPPEVPLASLPELEREALRDDVSDGSKRRSFERSRQSLLGLLLTADYQHSLSRSC